MEVRVAGVIPESVVDGPGIRSVIFAQGCPRHCPGCHNPEAIDPGGGKIMQEQEIINIVENTKLIKGVTFSGGEPFLQAQAFAQMGKKFKEKGLDIMTYTGYTWEELISLGQTKPEVLDLLRVSDYLVDGPFLESQKDLNLAFRGSRNQRVIDVAKSLEKSQVIPASFV